MNISGGWTGLGREVCGACKRQPCERMCRPTKKVEVHLEVGHVEQAGDDPLVALGVHVSLGPLVLGRLPAWPPCHPTCTHNCQRPVHTTGARLKRRLELGATYMSHTKDMWRASDSLLGCGPHELAAGRHDGIQVEHLLVVLLGPQPILQHDEGHRGMGGEGTEGSGRTPHTSIPYISARYAR
jgi:hypothetical protein